jgi:hypothetical protein
MSIDPSKFHLVNVTDTCAVWHILSSQRLYSAAKEAKCDFCMTEFVRYECLFKPRKPPTDANKMLIQRLTTEREHGAFKAHACSIDDLQAIKLLEQRKRLGKGELSSIAFAMKIRQAVITDDQKARKLASEAGHELVQTTPHLFSWLIFTGRLGDSDKSLVIGQHKKFGQSLTPHFERAYTMALEYRLNKVRSEKVPS